MPRFFIAQNLTCGNVFRLPEEIVRHIKALRLKDGAEITLFNGNGKEYGAQLKIGGKHLIDAYLATEASPMRESCLDITLIQVVSTGERMDFTVQKSVELGVNTIRPIISRHSNVRLVGERAERRVARWQEIAIAACEQCARNLIPQILPVIALDGLLCTPPTADVHYLLSPSGRLRLRDIEASPSKICLMVGAEGGFSTEEEAAAIKAGFLPLKLGTRILRTETAAITAIAALQTRWGDF